MKKLMTLILAFSLCLASIPTFAGVTSYYDNKETSLTTAVTYYPALELLKSLGAEIQVDGKDFTAVLDGHILSYDDYYEVLTIDDNSYYVDDEVIVNNGDLYIPLSLLKNAISIDYTETHEVKLISPEAVEAQKARDKKKFDTLYPNLSMAITGLESKNLKETLLIEMKVTDVITEDSYLLDEYNDLEEAPSIKLSATTIQDVKSNGYHYDIALETNEYGYNDVEHVEVIILDGQVYEKDGLSWYQESADSLEKFKMNMNILPFFINHVNDIEKERVSGGYTYTLSLKEAPISVFLDAVGNQYADAMEIDDIEDDYNVQLKDMNWQMKVNHKGDLLTNSLTGQLSMYDDWSESTMVLSFDLNAAYESSDDIKVESPIAMFNQQTPINLEKMSIELNDQPLGKKLDLRLADNTLLIKAEDLTHLMNAAILNDYYTSTISVGDDTLVFEWDSNEVLVNQTQYMTTASTIEDNGIYYVPLKPAMEFLGGLCFVDAEENITQIYTPEFTTQKYFSQETSSLSALNNAIEKVDTTAHTTTRDILFEIDNFVEIVREYSSYDLSNMNTKITEKDQQDPSNKYLYSLRHIETLSDYGDIYDMHLISKDDTLYYSVQYEDEDLYWYHDDEVAYERMVHSELNKYNKVKSLLKPVAGQKNKYALSIKGDDITAQEQAVMRSLLYEGIILDFLYNFPIDSVSMQTADLSYQLGEDGLIQVQSEAYTFEYNDGERSFDINFKLDLQYDDFYKAVNNFVPEISE